MFSSNLSRLGLDVTRISSTTVTAEAHTGAKKGSSSRTGNTSNLCACVRACVDDHVSSLKCVCVRSSKRVDFNYTEMALFIPGVLVQRLQLLVPGTVHTHVNHTHTHTSQLKRTHTQTDNGPRQSALWLFSDDDGVAPSAGDNQIIPSFPRRGLGPRSRRTARHCSEKSVMK